MGIERQRTSVNLLSRGLRPLVEAPVEATDYKSPTDRSLWIRIPSETLSIRLGLAWLGLANSNSNGAPRWGLQPAPALYKVSSTELDSNNGSPTLTSNESPTGAGPGAGVPPGGPGAGIQAGVSKGTDGTEFTPGVRAKQSIDAPLGVMGQGMVRPLQLLALVCFFGIAACGGSDSGMQEVENLLEHWKQLAHGMPKGAVVREAYAMSDQQLGDFAKNQGEAHSVNIFRYHVANNSFTCFNHDQSFFPEYCRGYLGFLHHVVAQPAYRSLLTHDFAWYHETAWGFSVGSHSHLLPLPIVANARNPENWHGDIYSMPCPDNFMAWAYYRYLLGAHRDDLKEDKFHPNSWRIFTHNFSAVPWEDKIDNIIYRARAWGTQDPDLLNPRFTLGQRFASWPRPCTLGSSCA
eukprot:gene10430-8380_t